VDQSDARSGDWVAVWNPPSVWHLSRPGKRAPVEKAPVKKTLVEASGLGVTRSRSGQAQNEAVCRAVVSRAVTICLGFSEPSRFFLSSGSIRAQHRTSVRQATVSCGSLTSKVESAHLC
jgi:hypothetical protein